MSNLIPCYLTFPVEKEVSKDTYLESRGFKPLRPGQFSYWQNYPEFFVSFRKVMYGEEATGDNDFCYGWLPKLDVVYDVLRVFELMHQGRVNGYFCQGFSPLMAVPNKKKLINAFGQLRFLVVDPPATETASFWENRLQFNDVDPTKVENEVFRLPTTCFAEEDGSLTNSGRWLQWHWKGADGPGDRKEGGAFPDPILDLHWPYKLTDAPSSEEIAREING